MYEKQQRLNFRMEMGFKDNVNLTDHFFINWLVPH